MMSKVVLFAVAAAQDDDSLSLVQLRAAKFNDTSGHHHRHRVDPTPADSCIDLSTPINDGGGGDTHYFDRHTVSCNGGVLASWKLERPSDEQIAFSYKCCPVNGQTAFTTNNMATAQQDAGGGNLRYLDRHRLECFDGQALTEFHLLRQGGDNSYVIQYACADLGAETDCHSQETDSNQVGSESYYLDRHASQCGGGKVMSGWKMFSSDNSMHVESTCCIVEPPTTTTTTTVADSASAVDDPHIKSMHGDKFDIYASDKRKVSIAQQKKGSVHNQKKTVTDKPQ